MLGLQSRRRRRKDIRISSVALVKTRNKWWRVLTASVDDFEVRPALGSAGIAEGRTVGGDRAVAPAVAQVYHFLRRVARQTGWKINIRFVENTLRWMDFAAVFCGDLRAIFVRLEVRI